MFLYYIKTIKKIFLLAKFFTKVKIFRSHKIVFVLNLILNFLKKNFNVFILYKNYKKKFFY